MSTPSRLAYANDPTIARRPRFLTRTSRRALLLLYPVLVAILVIGAVIVVSHEVTRADEVAQAEAAAHEAQEDTTNDASQEPTFHIPSPQEMENAFDPTLVTVEEATDEAFGTMVKAQVTEYGVDSPEILATHLSQVLDGTCINNLTLHTPDNLAIKFWDYCYNAPGSADLETLINYADYSGALSIAFSHFPNEGEPTSVDLVWQTDNSAHFDRIVRSWNSLASPGTIDQVDLIVFGTGELADQSVYGHLYPKGLQVMIPGKDAPELL